MLWALEATLRLEGAKTSTSQACTFHLPRPIKNVPYAELSKINFTSSKSKKRALDGAIDRLSENIDGNIQLNLSDEKSPSKSRKYYIPDVNSKKLLFDKFNSSKANNAILAILPPYNALFSEVFVKLPCMFHELYQENLRELESQELLKSCLDYAEKLSLTSEQSLKVEELTREQSHSENWIKMRRGRLTASNIYKVCQTSTSTPAMSLLKPICY